MASITAPYSTREEIRDYLATNPAGSNPVNQTVFGLATQLLDENRKLQNQLSEANLKLANQETLTRDLQTRLGDREHEQGVLMRELRKILSKVPEGDDMDAAQKEKLSRITTGGVDGTIQNMEELFRQMVLRFWHYEVANEELQGQLNRKEEDILSLRAEMSRRASTATMQDDNSLLVTVAAPAVATPAAAAATVAPDGHPLIPFSQKQLRMTHQLLQCLTYAAEASTKDLLHSYFAQRDQLPETSSVAEQAALLEHLKKPLFRYLRCILVLHTLHPFAEILNEGESPVKSYFTEDLLTSWKEDSFVRCLLMLQEKHVSESGAAECAQRWMANIDEGLPTETVEVLYNTAMDVDEESV
ncbi:hypothetical protein EKO04_011605 [Ascochyta lentis]|uniref:Uncharacterized protein n=1 Tax=Ascochyta lentis TaxID=205686 RepID=A0A8H7IW59_9PLEO|nr:hypothetical protein EKO04_011605 [Ascochyta lentis]